MTNSSANNKDQGNKSMPRQQQQHVAMRNSVATWENIVAIKVEKNPTKNVATQ